MLLGRHACRGMDVFGVEAELHDWFLSCPCRTDDPEAADLFFVPHYFSCLLQKQFLNQGETNMLMTQLISNLPYFDRLNGKNHIFTFPGKIGPDGSFLQWRQYIRYGTQKFLNHLILIIILILILN